MSNDAEPGGADEVERLRAVVLAALLVGAAVAGTVAFAGASLAAGAGNEASEGTKPTADAGSDRTVDSGSSLRFDGSASSDDDGIRRYLWDFDGDGMTDAVGETAEHTYSQPGTYVASLTVIDTSGNTDTDTVRVTVRDATPPTTNESTPAPTGANGTEPERSETNETTDSESATESDASAAEGGESDEATTDESGQAETPESAGDPDPLVSVDRAPNATSVTVAKASGPTTLHLANATGRDGVPSAAFRVDRLTVDAPVNEYSLTVSTHATVPGNRSVPTRTETGDFDGGYLRVDHSLPADPVSNATVAFTVGWPALAADTSASEVVLYRYHDGAWRPLETELTGYTEDGARFEASTPRLSVFAVGSRLAPNVTVESAVESRTVGVDQPVNVSAAVTNDGTAGKLVVVALRSNGTTLDTNSATLGANESATLPLRTSFERTGSYDLVVEDSAVGSVTVVESVSTTPTPTFEATATDSPTPTGTPTEPASAAATGTPAASGASAAHDEAVPAARSGVTSIGPVVAVLCGLAVASGLVWRRD